MQGERDGGRRRRRPQSTPQVRRSLQGQSTPHLSVGAREGWIERNGGSDTPVPWGTHQWRRGKDGRKTNLFPDL